MGCEWFVCAPGCGSDKGQRLDKADFERKGLNLKSKMRDKKRLLVMWLSRFAASATFLVLFQRWTPAAAGKGLFWRGTEPGDGGWRGRKRK